MENDEKQRGRIAEPDQKSSLKTSKLSDTSKGASIKDTMKADESLIPIKGIDVERRNRLIQLGIGTVSELLQQGRTVEQRQKIAEKLLRLEKGTIQESTDAKRWEKVYINYVNSWVKQVDLWRISGMDVDTAYFLVELGVRHVEDVTKIDVDKAYAMMKSLANSHPEYTLVTYRVLDKLIENAKKVPSRYPKYQKRLTDQMKQPMTQVRRKIKDTLLIGNEVEASKLIDQLLSKLSKIKMEDILGGSSIECDEPAPTYLFVDDVNSELGTAVATEEVSNIQVIQKGLGYLKEIEAVLPLPKSIRGIVYKVKSGIVLPSEKEQRKGYVFTDALVEINGIASPTEDKSESGKDPQGYTDGNGEFMITLPDKYNMQESITITISQGCYKQKFVLAASDVIEHVEKQKIVKAFQMLDIVVDDIDKEKTKLGEIPFVTEFESKIAAGEEISITEQAKYDEYTEELNMLQKQKDNLIKKIQESDDTSNDLERILRNMMLDQHLVSDFRESPFIINEELFRGYQMNQHKILPSVKLMEKDNMPLYLPTDTAPSRVFEYSMLQRLVEPAISPLADKVNSNPRMALKQSVDVMNFKKTISESPNQWPQMSSLGIGYVLNMHQAWVPDGFALGNLLYSLVLAPGEEQRLIVREKTQSYEVSDESEGVDATAESYALSQMDNTTAAYSYALDQMMQGNSSYNYSTKATSASAGLGLGAIGDGFAAMFGLTNSVAKSSGKGSSSASQSNSHNEVSNAAQSFQHGIKTASERISQAQRVSITMATSQENDSVATRIIANHNHSHAMTIQYWEVMRRYRMETCVDNVDLVLFVPLKLIQFLNGQSYTLDSVTSYRSIFNTRYDVLLKYADTLSMYLPRNYRAGINLIKQYAAYPDWKLEDTTCSNKEVTLTFTGVFLSFDDIKVTLILKNGKGCIAGDAEYTRLVLSDKFETSAQLKEAIKKIRNGYDIENSTDCESKPDYNKCTCKFTLPSDVSENDFSYVRIDYSVDTFKYVLYQNPSSIGADGENAQETYQYMMDKTWDLVKDRKDSAADIRKIGYFKEMLPEAWTFPNVTIRGIELKALGVPTISDFNMNLANGEKLGVSASGSELRTSVRVTITTQKPIMRYVQLQQIESTMHHIVSNTMKYSQVIWASLSSDERALMLEQYTIDMDFKDISQDQTASGKKYDDIPLLNCINVKKLLGFYGNCMLFPFTYPQKLADRLGKSAGELQDALYRYHTNYFRVPSTTISLPTDGMIGEAVLGETNVSEEIDLTRFWNWKDSPIDKMSLDNEYLNSVDYLLDKKTKDITALDIKGATVPEPVTVPDLIKALVEKKTPEFSDITGLKELKDILAKAIEGTDNGRNKALEATTGLAKSALEFAYKKQEADAKNQETKPNGSGGSGEAKPGGSGETKPGGGEEQKPGGGEEEKPGGGEEEKPGGGEEEKPGGGEEQNPGGGEEQKPGGGEEQKPDGNEKPDGSEQPGGGGNEQPGGGGNEQPGGGGNKSPIPQLKKEIDYNLLENVMEQMVKIYSENTQMSPAEIAASMGVQMTPQEIDALAKQFCEQNGISLDQLDHDR